MVFQEIVDKIRQLQEQIASDTQYLHEMSLHRAEARNLFTIVAADVTFFTPSHILFHAYMYIHSFEHNKFCKIYNHYTTTSTPILLITTATTTTTSCEASVIKDFLLPLLLLYLYYAYYFHPHCYYYYHHN